MAASPAPKVRNPTQPVLPLTGCLLLFGSPLCGELVTSRAEMWAENSCRRPCCCFEEYLRSSGRGTQAGPPTAQCHEGPTHASEWGGLGPAFQEVILQR